MSCRLHVLKGAADPLWLCRLSVRHSPVLHSSDGVAQTMTQAGTGAARNARIVTTATEIRDAAVAVPSRGGACVPTGAINEARGSGPDRAVACLHERVGPGKLHCCSS